jgi:hypothetical protein
MKEKGGRKGRKRTQEWQSWNHQSMRLSVEQVAQEIEERWVEEGSKGEGGISLNSRNDGEGKEKAHIILSLSISSLLQYFLCLVLRKMVCTK